LTELDLPSSGITQHEQRYNKYLLSDVTQSNYFGSPESDVMIYFSAQIQLCLILSQVISWLYQTKGVVTTSDLDNTAFSMNIDN